MDATYRVRLHNMKQGYIWLQNILFSLSPCDTPCYCYGLSLEIILSPRCHPPPIPPLLPCNVRDIIANPIFFVGLYVGEAALHLD